MIAWRKPSWASEITSLTPLRPRFTRSFKKPDQNGSPNFMMDDEGEARVRAAFGDNYERLAALKKKYDPVNLFRVNQNIRPAP